MSKETIKLYAPRVEKNTIEIMEILKDAYKENRQAYLDLGLFETYEKAKKQLDFELNVSKLITNHIGIRTLKSDVARLEEQLAIPNCDDKVKGEVKELEQDVIGTINDIGILRGLIKCYDKQFTETAKEQVHFSERIEQLSRKLNGKDNRVDSLSGKIDNIKKESKRGQDLLLGRIKEFESELEKQKTPPNLWETMVDVVMGTVIGFGFASIIFC